MLRLLTTLLDFYVILVGFDGLMLHLLRLTPMLGYDKLLLDILYNVSCIMYNA